MTKKPIFIVNKNRTPSICNRDLMTPAIYLQTPNKLTRYVIEELKAAYSRFGWVPLEGKHVIAFVSPNGEWFNSYEIETGYKSIFGTEWAKNALEMASKKQERNSEQD